MAKCCALAKLLAQLVDAHPELERMGPVELNIVCFRFIPPQRRPGPLLTPQHGPHSNAPPGVSPPGQVGTSDMPDSAAMDTTAINAALDVTNDRAQNFSGYVDSGDQSGRESFAASALNDLNAQIVFTLHEEGIVAPSQTTLFGSLAIRAAIVNHRTEEADIRNLVEGVLRVGRELSKQEGD